MAGIFSDTLRFSIVMYGGKEMVQNEHEMHEFIYQKKNNINMKFLPKHSINLRIMFNKL